jgi:hypothetical protein
MENVTELRILLYFLLNMKIINNELNRKRSTHGKQEMSTNTLGGIPEGERTLRRLRHR